MSNKKHRDTAAADAEMAERRKRENEREDAGENGGKGTKDVLGDGEDEDVIF